MARLFIIKLDKLVCIISIVVLWFNIIINFSFLLDWLFLNFSSNFCNFSLFISILSLLRLLLLLIQLMILNYFDFFFFLLFNLFIFLGLWSSSFLFRYILFNKRFLQFFILLYYWIYLILTQNKIFLISIYLKWQRFTLLLISKTRIYSVIFKA